MRIKLLYVAITITIFLAALSHQLALSNDPGKTSDIVIAIDAGHGGENDPGVISINNLVEKDVTLDIAKRIAKLVEEKSGWIPWTDY